MKKIINILSFLSFLIPAKAYAASIIPTTDWGSCVNAAGVATLDCIPIVLQNIINFLVLFAGVVCVFLIVFAGFKFVTSEGDPEKVAASRKTMLYALGGFIFVLLSFVILNFISKFTGVDRIAPH